MVEAGKLALDAELVPLRVAAQVAYFHITEALRQVDSHDGLEQIVPLVAIALATVAPILRDDGSVLRERELRVRLYVRRPDLDGLAIRRADLKVAMTTLKEARVMFGGSK